MTPPDDWQMVRDGIGSFHEAEVHEAEAAIARLREREAQTAELYEQKIERIEELTEREAQRDQELLGWKRNTVEQQRRAEAAEALRAETSTQLTQVCGERDRAEARVAELIHERNAHHERAERADARVAEVERLSAERDLRVHRAEARVRELENKLNEDSQTFHIETLKAERELLRAHVARLEKALWEINLHPNEAATIARRALAHEEER